MSIFLFFSRIHSNTAQKRSRIQARPYSAYVLDTSEDELREVAVDHDIGQALIDVGRIDDDVLIRELRCAEADVFEDLLEQGVQAASTDVLGLLIDLTGELCDAADGIGLEGKRDAFRREQGLVLLDQGVLRLGQDALEILLAQRLELDAESGPGAPG